MSRPPIVARLDGLIRVARRISSVLVTWFSTPTGIWIAGAFVVSLGLKLTHSPLLPVPGVITMLVIPGAAMMSVLGARPANTAGRLVLAVCLSMVVIMVVGAAASLIGPHFGVARPLDSIPQDLIWLAIMATIARLGTTNRTDPLHWVFQGTRIPHLYVGLASGLLPVLSILGVAQLNHSKDVHLAITASVLDVAVLLAGIVGGWKRGSRWPLSTLLYSASLALLLSSSLRGGNLYGWDIQKEFGVASHTLATGRWAIPADGDPYASMLSLTVLPTVLSSVVKLRLLAFFQLVVPAILALLPVAIFATVRGVPRYLKSRRLTPRPGLAFAAVSALVVSSSAFSSDLVSIDRQAMALTMLTAIVLVLFDRTMPERSSRAIIAILIIAISFTHYTTSYLLAGILAMAWLVSVAWTRIRQRSTLDGDQVRRWSESPRMMVNVALVIVAMIAAFGWNLGITHNYALSGPTAAVATKGAGFVNTPGLEAVSATTLSRILASELHQSAKWLKPLPDSASVPLLPPVTSGAQNSNSSVAPLWNWLNFLLQEGLWLLAGAALLLGLALFLRHRVDYLSPDLVGLTVSVLLLGGFLRFSGTLASFYSPSRAAIFVAIFVTTPITMLVDDAVTLLNHRLATASLFVVLFAVGTMNVWATGLGTLMFGGAPPGSLTVDGVNAQNFTVSTSEQATAIWIKNNVTARGVVQTDKYGQLVMLSEPAGYDLIDQIMPVGVGQGSFVYLSSSNLLNGLTTGTAAGGKIYAVYRTTLKFFNRNFNVVYSTGTTRVYH